jgi:hypothetical protein
VYRHQLGDGDLCIGGGHDQQHAALLKRQGKAGRRPQIVRTHGERDLADRVG